MKTYKAIGIMSGSSLDGIDVAYCVFKKEDKNWRFQISAAECYPYTSELHKKLKTIGNLSAEEFVKLDVELGKLFAEKVQHLLSTKKLSKPDFIGSHGHTAFHNPASGYTSQIGSGAVLNSLTQIPVICDLRTQDVALGGQGAPIVPLGEKYLFSNYKIFLNIGGIANIAMHEKKKIKAFDVCPANTLLNFYAQKEGKPFDESGNIARTGTCHDKLLEELNNLDFSLATFPKSLSTEYIMENYLPVLKKYKLSNADSLATVSEHIAIQVANQLKGVKPQKMLITGGGALNTFLIERMSYHLPGFKVKVPDFETVFYKEALVMAFLALMRLLGKKNVLSSVTGSKRDTVSGAIYEI